ncbi:MAG: alpha/beta hydrolase [Ruminococcaceae bacterium]|nr:alpha/beta hydrolase [Oscillospiraceae bacterium]
MEIYLGEGIVNKAEVVFTAIDIFGHPLQNARRFPGITCVEDIAYGEHEKQKGDLYFKEGLNKEDGKKPILLYIRGGGFILGDKSHRVTIGEYYANAGYYVFNINFRLPPEVDFNGQIYDCVMALNFIEELSETYNIDTDNIFISGDSSGACQTAFLGAVKYDDALREKINCPEIKIDLKGLILMSGIYDVEALVKRKKLFGVIPQTIKMILGFELNKKCDNFKDYEYYDCLSSMKFINEKWCSVFISWSKSDIFCKGQGEAMYEALKAKIDNVKTHSVKSLINNHCYHLFLKIDRYADECMQASIKFMDELVK